MLSILNSVKKMLGIAEEYTVYDADIIIHTNTALANLTQLGVGPVEGFMIEDDTATWDTFLGSDIRYNQAKTYVFLQVKLIFDPPDTSFAIDAIKNQLETLGWRLSIHRDTQVFNVNEALSEEPVLDGGSP